MIKKTIYEESWTMGGTTKIIVWLKEDREIEAVIPYLSSSAGGKESYHNGMVLTKEKLCKLTDQLEDGEEVLFIRRHNLID